MTPPTPTPPPPIAEPMDIDYPGTILLEVGATDAAAHAASAKAAGRQGGFPRLHQ